METTAPPFIFEPNPQFSTLQINPSLGEVNWGDVERVGTEVLKKVDELPNPTVVVDLSHLDYMGSVQVALLVRLWKSIKNRKGRMVVQVHSPMVQDVLKTAGLDKLWDFAETRPEALKVLGIRGAAAAAAAAAAGGASSAPSYSNYGNSSPVVPGIGIAAVLGAIACLAGQKFMPPAPGEVGLSIFDMAGYAFDGIAVAAGIYLALKGDVEKRGWGVGIAVAGLAIGAMQLLK